MRTETALFFPPHAGVLALPSHSNPRLYLISQSPSQRWQHTSFYPAFRWTARAHRTLLRLWTALGMGQTRHGLGGTWPLADFLRDCLPEARTAVVRLGTPGPSQKITVQLWSASEVVGYLKYATLPAARVRLENEHRVLTEIPKNIGPQVLRFAEFAEGIALVTAPAVGRPLPPRLPLSDTHNRLLDGLYQAEAFPLERHPWVRQLVDGFGSSVERWLEPIAGRKWQVVFRHGDFAPWNIVRSPTGNLTAIDWEFGDTKGFPYLDAIHYMLQVAALILRWSPNRAKAYAVQYMSRKLPATQAQALVGLAAFDAYQQAIEDGHARDTPLQVWRRGIWEAP